MNFEEYRVRWRLYFAEFLGTALLLLIGLSIVIIMFGDGSPAIQLIPNHKVRQLITGFLFGSVGGLIAISPIGKVSGAHINPAVTIGFKLMGKLDLRTALGYIISQIAGAIVGCLPLLFWGKLGKSVQYAATLPGIGFDTFTVVSGEVLTTCALIVGLSVFIAYRKIRKFTPLMIPFLYAILVPLEADISGTSTNPARTIGPAIISGQWEGWWIYWVGPLIGMLIGIIACSFLAKRIEVAKLYHFESDSRKFFSPKVDK